VLGAAFSDIFRYKLLYEKGNFWADLDVVCIRPFDFADPVVLAAEMHRPHVKPKYRIDSQDNIGLNCNVMKFPAGSPEMAFCYDQAVNFDRSQLVFGEIGPELTTLCAQKFRLERFIKPPEVFNPVHYFNFRDLVNPRRKPTFTSDTHAIHLWSGAWGNRTWKQKILNVLQQTPAQRKDDRFPKSTLYGDLLSRYLT
jgi:Glycosyltransferase sugar-binding region containing DXD motif